LGGRKKWRKEIRATESVREMPIDDLLQSVEVNAKERMQEILDRAKSESEDIIKEAKTREGAIRKKHLENAKKGVDFERIKTTTDFKEEQKMRINRVKDEIFQRAFQDARKKLLSIRNDPSYEAILRILTREALTEMGGKETIIHIDRRDEPLIRRILNDLKVNSKVVTDLDSIGGLTVQSPDGKFAVLNTFESRLERAKELIRSDIFSILYGE
jgi:vacuolar-type H+-ATPase subunit E/Vma4